MPPNLLEQALQTIELQLEKVSRVLVRGDALEIEVAMSKLRDLSVDFSQQLPLLLQRDGNAFEAKASFKLRLKRINDRLSSQRHGLSRLAVVSESALNMLVPTTRLTSYSAAATRYGSSARQTGAFKVLSA